jgi:hypothetical protein
MYRSILIALSAGVILVGFAALPPMLPGSTTMSLSGSALAQKTPTSDAINLNSSRSNVVDRMGGGGGRSGGAAKTTTVKSNKSNSSDRMGGGGGRSGGAVKTTTIKGSKSNSY